MLQFSLQGLNDLPSPLPVDFVAPNDSGVATNCPPGSTMKSVGFNYYCGSTPLGISSSALTIGIGVLVAAGLMLYLTRDVGAGGAGGAK